MPVVTPLPSVIRKAPIKSIAPITRLFPLCLNIFLQAIVKISFIYNLFKKSFINGFVVDAGQQISGMTNLFCNLSQLKNLSGRLCEE
ncbi:MAG: hypothetical protein A2386_03840 [Elusimicrobia bacterium RIFOXYB1_FULL_48_9]|nr:MAG: hypothetical protein A2386_03840 [Elusimicrobia bacterium RIFOXYB1_FULL_48_9]